MSTRSPDRRSFYKYADPETALAILRNKTVRYSSPLTFNDPFDVQSGLHFDFDIDTLHAKVSDRLAQLVAAVEEPAVDRNDPWGEVVLLARKYYPTHGFQREHWDSMTAPLFAYLISEIRTTQQNYQEHWWKTLLPGIRVFCVSEDRDNLLMWAHYAKDHTGVVFEFLSLPEEDNALSVAQPVIYVDRPAPFFTEKEWIEHILSLQKFNADELYKRYVYIKSKHWEYEREWRVWYPLIPAPPGTLHDDLPIRTSEFASIYIGCRAVSAFADDIIAMIRDSFPSTRVYCAHKSKTAYALEYEEI
jgi:hypothetical protein